MAKIVNLSVRPEFEPIWEEIQAMAKDEGKTTSAFIFETFREIQKKVGGTEVNPVGVTYKQQTVPNIIDSQTVIKQYIDAIENNERQISKVIHSTNFAMKYAYKKYAPFRKKQLEEQKKRKIQSKIVKNAIYDLSLVSTFSDEEEVITN